MRCTLIFLVAVSVLATDTDLKTASDRLAELEPKLRVTVKGDRRDISHSPRAVASSSPQLTIDFKTASDIDDGSVQDFGLRLPSESDDSAAEDKIHTQTHESESDYEDSYSDRASSSDEYYAADAANISDQSDGLVNGYSPDAALADETRQSATAANTIALQQHMRLSRDDDLARSGGTKTQGAPVGGFRRNSERGNQAGTGLLRTTSLNNDRNLFPEPGPMHRASTLFAEGYEGIEVIDALHPVHNPVRETLVRGAGDVLTAMTYLGAAGYAAARAAEPYVAPVVPYVNRAAEHLVGFTNEMIGETRGTRQSFPVTYIAYVCIAGALIELSQQNMLDNILGPAGSRTSGVVHALLAFGVFAGAFLARETVQTFAAEVGQRRLAADRALVLYRAAVVMGMGRPAGVPSAGDQCPICMGDFGAEFGPSVCSLTCGHAIHRKCAMQWASHATGNTCPLCRHRMVE